MTAVREEEDPSSSDDDHDYWTMDPTIKADGDIRGLEPSILDPRDAGTTDHWVQRSPSLIRLTGKHPFNSEPPLSLLMQLGFITPAPIHYVRNHGPVPSATWHGWRVEVAGLVRRPARFTMDQLVSEFPAREFPVTLVCAGNRRKEQNMVKQTVGFNWGAAGVSTSVWRGTPLRCLLRRCGIMRRRDGAANVCFEGAEDLPGGGGSDTWGGVCCKYATSVRREIAMDPGRDLLVAYMQNGERLLPDHGFPVRIIIPGLIGGRMVKWLKRIVVTPQESDTYYHYKDNRVLPSHVDADLANAQAWWYKPEYIINELNVNSVITSPPHGEFLPANTWTTQQPYTLRGYAYSGGGRRVTRVEVTTNGGESWHLCGLDQPEKPNKFGKYWCWSFWWLELEVLSLLEAQEIAVRAWDESHNTQPEKLIWNVMGMMNNCWFRVKTKVSESTDGKIGIVFQHPTLPSSQPGGWMIKSSEPALVTQKTTLPASASSSVNRRAFSLRELKKHDSPSSAWIVVRGNVYDCTRFLSDHPGGANSILINAGTDCTEEFQAIHSDNANKLLEDFRVGELIPESPPKDTDDGVSNAATPGKYAPSRGVAMALVPGEKIQCKLVSKSKVSRDVRRFRFALPSEDQVLGLPLGKHVVLCAAVLGKLCMWAYTPTTAVDQVGFFDLVVRIYFAGEDPNFAGGGVMSQYLDSLPVGSTVEVKGPLGHLEYAGRGVFTVHGRLKFARKLAMVAGGTGITPMYQVIQAVMRDPGDETEMHLVYACRTEEDILLREELDAWAEEGRLKVWYVVGRTASAREGWRYGVGRVTEDTLREHLPAAATGAVALACGPPAMIELAVRPIFEKMNYARDSLLVF